MQSDLILGCGFLGLRLAKRLLQQDGNNFNSRVYTLTRSSEKAQRLRELGLQVHVADLANADIHKLAIELRHEGFPNFRSITICIGNDSDQLSHETVYQNATELAIELCRLQDLADDTGRTQINFVSTTGVYSDDSSSSTDNWVDEDWPCQPKRPGSIASYQCEQTLCNLPAAIAGTCVFRLAGIYDVDRIPNLANLRAGKPLTGQGDGWLNLIHAEDAAEILARAISDPPQARVLNVSDGNPIPRRDFYQQIANHLQLPAPTFDQSANGRGGKKRIDNGRLLRWMPFQFRQVSDPATWQQD